MWGPNQAVTVQATGNLYNAEQFRQVIVAYHHSAPVYLRDVALVTDDVQNNRTAAWFNDARSIQLSVMRQPGTNTVEVTANVRKVLDEIRGEIPPDVNLVVAYDRATSINRGVHDVKFTLGVALVLVVLVIFVFLRNISATIIPSLALPMSIIGTFSVMYLLHYSIDNLSLMALTLAVGFVVDDAIVVLENIVRHMEMGKPRMQAALDGAAEVGSTIVTMTTSLSAVFIPIMFMGGLIGMLFHEFGVTIAVAILVSGCVSLTLTPMLCSRFLSPVQGRQPRAALSVVRARLRRGPARLRAQSRLDHAAAPPHARALGPHARAHGRAVPGHPQRIPAQRRHRSAHGNHRGRGRHLICGNPPPPAQDQ